jgi:hypothetical protein
MRVERENYPSFRECNRNHIAVRAVGIGQQLLGFLPMEHFQVGGARPADFKGEFLGLPPHPVVNAISQGRDA